MWGPLSNGVPCKRPLAASSGALRPHITPALRLEVSNVVRAKLTEIELILISFPQQCPSGGI